MNEAIIKISGENIDDILVDILEYITSIGLKAELQKKDMICIDYRKIEKKIKNNKIGMLYTGFGQNF